jgi:hypothetical protein
MYIAPRRKLSVANAPTKLEMDCSAGGPLDETNRCKNDS